MNPTATHRNAEYKAKAHLRDQYTTHHTSVDLFERPQWMEYDRMVYDMGETIFVFKMKMEGLKGIRDYLSTSTIDL